MLHPGPINQELAPEVADGPGPDSPAGHQRRGGAHGGRRIAGLRQLKRPISLPWNSISGHARASPADRPIADKVATVGEVASLQPGVIIEFPKQAGQDLAILVNNTRMEAVRP